jgi:O-antigen/teichoic acid export membrane protein
MRAIEWVAFEKFAQQAVWLLLFFILAPKLGPRPYGEFAIAMVFVGFCELVMVDAAVEALLSMAPLEPMHLRSCNLFCFLLALFVGGAIFLMASSIGRAFGDAEVGPVLEAISVLPAISVLTSAPLAVLKSQLRFGPIALRSTLGLSIGGVCGVVLAFHGAGVWALVAQLIIQRVAEVIILWSSANIRYGFGWSKRHFSELYRFARYVFFSKGTAFAGAQIPRLILGSFMGPFELGLFVFAARLPDTLIWTTLVPTTSVYRIRLRQYSPGQKELSKAFAQLLEDTALVAFPIVCGSAAIAPLVFTIALDNRWQPAALPTQMLIMSVIPMLLYFAATSVLLALKFPRDESILSFAQMVFNALIVLCTAPYGLNVVCFWIASRPVLLLPILFRILSRRCGIAPHVIGAAIFPALIASLVMGCAVMFAEPVFERGIGLSASLFALVGLGVLVYAVMVGIIARQGGRRLVANIRRFGSRENATAHLNESSTL